jgi:uracil-DNA glycosylase
MRILPPSLINIYKELASDLGPANFKIPTHGDLSAWARQGVLLLNTSLTVRAHEAASHAGKGWEQFTDSVIRAINDHRKNVVFLLWGNHAQRKSSMIDRSRHLILTAVHPSPLSASRGWFGCRHFSKTNEYLQQHGITPIDWQLPND